MSTPPITASSALSSGSRLGEFEITGVIGEGGFGIVYSARDSSLDRIVAIKEYLPSAFAGRTTAGTVQVRSEEHTKTFNAGLSSFINEARMLAKFSHPGLVEVFRFWEANGTAYMAMRYYRGVTLREMLRTNPQVATEQWLCETLDPILLALQELHHEKCYHRDIAPDNILVLPNGRSVLMDFGAARRIIGGMTRALTTVLKPGYAPIEQYSDDGSMQQGAWTDIYAVGGVLYHAMTGKVPVQAISRMMNDPLKPVATAARGAYTPNLCSVVMKCLAVMPENRYQSIDELREALGWVTTPVSSTVILQRTAYAAPLTGLSTPPGAALAAQSTTVVAPPVRSSLDPLANVVAAREGPDALAALLDGTNVQATPDRAESLEEPLLKPAKVFYDIGGASASGQSAKRNLLPLIVVGIASLAVIGSAAYLLMAPASSGDADRPKVVEPATVEAKPELTSPVQAPTSTGESVEPAATPAVTPDAPRVIERSDSTLTPSGVATSNTPVDASKTDAAAIVKGTVTFDIKPWGNVAVNGAAVGPSPPLKRLSLAPGTYTIEIQNPAGSTLSRTVEVLPSKSVTLRHSF